MGDGRGMGRGDDDASERVLSLPCCCRGCVLLVCLRLFVLRLSGYGGASPRHNVWCSLLEACFFSKVIYEGLTLTRLSLLHGRR